MNHGHESKNAGPKLWSRALFVLAGLAFVWALFPLLTCMWAQFKSDELPDEERAEGHCLEQHPASQSGLAWFFFGVTLVGGIVVRRLPEPDEPRVLGSQDRAWPSSDSDRVPYVPRSFAAPVPEAIELSQELDLGRVEAVEDDELEHDDRESLMAYMQEEEALQLNRRDKDDGSDETIEGFYCPPGMKHCAIVYVDANYDEAHGGAGKLLDDEDRFNNPARPFSRIGAALEFALKSVQRNGERVQVRLMPGLYHESIEIPDRVVVVNHRMPAEGTLAQRSAWMVGLEDVSHNERVTILAPSTAKVAVRLMPGRLQGVFGCHVLGREGLAQIGVVARESVASALLHCTFEGFARGGAHITGCGEELDGEEFAVMGCAFNANTAEFGGAIFVEESVMRLEECTLTNNVAASGGGLYARNLRAPLVLQGCQMGRNRAFVPQGSITDPAELSLDEWSKAEGQTPGLGGAVYVHRARLKATDCIFEGNDATLGGGALAATGSRLLIHSTGRHSSVRKCVFSGNRAQIGGALLCVGWPGDASTLKSKGAHFSINLATGVGGAIALVGLVTAQAHEALIESNASREARGKRCVGAGVACIKGAYFEASASRVSSNRSAMHGGGLAAINSSIRLTGDTRLESNVAEGGDGGGIYFITEADPEIERLARREHVKVPLALCLEEVLIQYNTATNFGGGIRVGNKDPAPTIPISLSVSMPNKVWSNLSDLPESANAADASVVWASDTHVIPPVQLEPFEILLK